MTETHHHIDARGIRLHVVERGRGPLVLFCHGFPSTWICWRSAMTAVADAGYRAVAFDMRGFGDSDAPPDAADYTAFETTGDVVAIADHLGHDRAIIVGHDFGASTAWHAAMMRPDRIAAVFGVSVPFAPIGDASFLTRLRTAGRDTFYMFAQMTEAAETRWADAAHSIPACLYWTSGEPPPDERWDPFDPARDMLRPAPTPAIDPEYVAQSVAAFARTGFHAPLNYYRAIEPFFARARRTFAGAPVAQPCAFLTGAVDGLNAVRQPTEASLRAVLPGLTAFVELPGVGHWPQLEAPAAFEAALLAFLREVA